MLELNSEIIIKLPPNIEFIFLDKYVRHVEWVCYEHEKKKNIKFTPEDLELITWVK